MTRARTFFAVAVLAGALTAGTARADSLFGEYKRLPDQIERGFTLGADFGLMFLLGDKLTAKSPGFNLTFTTGYDLLKFLSIEGVYQLGISEADPADLVLQGSVLTFMFDLAAKIGWPLGRFYPFVELGPGVHLSYPEWVPGDSNLAFGFLAAGGIEYYTYLRHFSLFLKAAYNYSSAPIDTLVTSIGIRYSF
jgi:hypothetical protein